MTANFSPDEVAKIDAVCQKQGILKKATGTPNHYALLRRAVLAYCETCLEQEKNKNGKEGTRNSAGQSSEVHGEPSQKGRGSDGIAQGDSEVPLAEAANHADPLDIGFF